MYGLPDYPFVTVRHPLKNLDFDELQRRVDGALPQLKMLLTTSH